MFLYWIIAFLIISLILLYFFYKKKGFLFYSKYGLPNIFLFLAVILSAVSFFNFNFFKQQNLISKNSNIVFVLDVSKSMLALDYVDKSRLDIAKNFVRNYVWEHLENHYWLTIFSWDVTWILPITNDKNLFFTFLESVDEKSILKWWTDFLSAIQDSIARFEDNNWWAIVILSDFEPNIDSNQKQILLNQISKLKPDLDKKNVKIYLIWVWKTTWNKINIWYDFFGFPSYLKDDFGKDVVTKFDKDFFDNLSSTLNSQKNIINNIQDIKNIFLENIPFEETQELKDVKMDFSRYIMMLSYVFFLMYLALFYYFDKKNNK